MSSPKFMVIDDDRALLDIMGAILKSLGCDSEPFYDGGLALKELHEKARSDQFEAIFLDIMMPDLDGYEVLKKLKEQPTTASIPVIMLTAKNGYNEIIDGYNGGADYYLTKPVTKDQLVYALDVVLSSEEDSSKEDEPRRRWLLPEAE